MAERRSTGAESLALFDQTLDRLLAGSGYDPAVQERVLDAVRVGASTVGRITAATGLTRSIVEQAVNALAVRGLVASKPRPSRRRRTAPARATDQVAKTG